MYNIVLSILENSKYELKQFDDKEINAIEELVFLKTNKKNEKVPYVRCQVRDKDIKLTDEELVRQLYVYKLINTYNYPLNNMELEYSVSFGKEKKRADIVIFDKVEVTTPYIIVELKKPKLKDGKEQLKSYCNATGAPIGIWTNGGQISYYHRKDPNYFEDITDIPNFNEKLSDILSERWTIDDLVVKQITY